MLLHLVPQHISHLSYVLHFAFKDILYMMLCFRTQSTSDVDALLGGISDVTGVGVLW